MQKQGKKALVCFEMLKIKPTSSIIHCRREGITFLMTNGNGRRGHLAQPYLHTLIGECGYRWDCNCDLWTPIIKKVVAIWANHQCPTSDRPFNWPKFSEFHVESNYMVCKEGKPYQEQKDVMEPPRQIYATSGSTEKEKLLWSHHAHQYNVSGQ